MAAGSFDIFIEAGTDYNHWWVYNTATPVSPNCCGSKNPDDYYLTPVDITGWTARMQIKRSIDDVSYIDEYTTENDHIDIEGEEGKVTLNIPNAETSELSGSYVYDMELIDTEGTVIRFIQGSVSVSPEVTRPEVVT